MDIPLSIPGADLGRKRVSTHELVDCLSHVVVNGETIPILDLDQDVERGRRTAFQHCFLGTASAGFFI
jgi:hypothetical protein